MPRPPELAALPLPPDPMPGRHGLRPLKSWRYVAAFAPEVMLCACAVRIGPARQSFWAVWDRQSQVVHERTALGTAGVTLASGGLRIESGAVRAELRLEEAAGVECICPSGSAYAWTRKQGGIPITGRLSIAGRERTLSARGIVDDSAGYHPRHTRWNWSAGVGTSLAGQPVAWNLVSGINDPDLGSERAVWIDGELHEPPPSQFSQDLRGVDGLRFHAEAEHCRHQNLLVVRSFYRQPFGTFSGRLPGGVELAEGLGVMEQHDVHW